MPIFLKKVHETDFSHGCVLLFGPSLQTQGCTAGPDKLLLNQGDLFRGSVNLSVRPRPDRKKQGPNLSLPKQSLEFQYQFFLYFNLKQKTFFTKNIGHRLELVSKELNHLAAILHVYAGGLNFMK